MIAGLEFTTLEDDWEIEADELDQEPSFTPDHLMGEVATHTEVTIEYGVVEPHTDTIVPELSTSALSEFFEDEVTANDDEDLHVSPIATEKFESAYEAVVAEQVALDPESFAETAKNRDDQPFEAEYDQLVAEQIWDNTEELPDTTASFFAHVQMIQKRSEDLGIENEYSEEALSVMEGIDQLYEVMLTYDDFYQFICECKDELGMSDSFMNAIFDNEHDHAHHDHGPSSSDGEKKKRDKDKKKSSKNMSLYELIQAVLAK